LAQADLIGANVAEKCHVLVLTGDDDADHFTKGVVEGLRNAKKNVHLWCLWLDTTLEGLPSNLSKTSVLRQYRDVFPSEFSEVIVCRSLATDPAIIRTMLSLLEDAEKAGSVILPALVQIWSAAIALGEGDDLAMRIPYFAGRTHFVSEVIDTGRRFVEKVGITTEEAYNLPHGRDRLHIVPKLVIDAKASRPRPSPPENNATPAPGQGGV
jgi:hypothetical protein